MGHSHRMLWYGRYQSDESSLSRPRRGRVQVARVHSGLRKGGTMAIVVLVLWLFTVGVGFYLLVTSNLGRARPATATPATATPAAEPAPAESAPAESATVSAAATAAS